jgi:hypothetical protein
MSLTSPVDWLHEVYDAEFGLRFTNFSIKPVHVANGLSRALTGRSYRTEALSHTLRRWVTKQKLGVDEERYPNEQILASYGVAFEPLKGSKPDTQRLNRLRALAKDVLGADKALFPDADKSSFTLSNERFITRDPSDVRAGLFLARLMRAEPVDRQDAADLFMELLTTETDAWTTLALPLLALGEARVEVLDGAAGERAAKADHLFAADGAQLASPTLAVLRDSFDRLARFERLGGSKLNSMRRIVLFGCFVVHVHAISRWHERNAGAPRPPILLDMFDGTVKSVRDASRATLRAGGDAVEGLVLERFADYVTADIGSSAVAIGEALSADGVDAALKIDVDNLVAGGRAPAHALSQVLVDAALNKVREHPIGSLVELGRRAGFLTPWGNSGRGGKLQKRYTATAEFLETLIAATIEPNQPLEFPEFLDRLSEDFGIVVGRPEDDRVIRHNNVHGAQFGPPTAINEEDLRRNVSELRKLVVETGYGKSYADGRTIVTTAPEGDL